jgi:low affinity Fe/Cu permease
VGSRQRRRRVPRAVGEHLPGLVAALTLAMVFVIQHTQARQQAATQRKLDEILQALPGADNSLLALEHASDDELRAAGESHREIRQAALDEQSG